MYILMSGLFMANISGCICYLAVCVFCYSHGAIAESTSTLEEVNKQIVLLQKKVEQLEKEQQYALKSLSPPPSENALSDNKNKIIRNNKVEAYATLRPTFGYIEEDGENLWDVRDALSHAGFKATTEFKEDWSAVLHGEWGIDLSNNGDFGRARQVYVALNSPFGEVGIGKQRPVQYLFIAEYVDIFNHANSPFAYDPESIFFVDNLVTYKLATGDFSWMLASQFNGESGDNNSDLTNVGVSYDNKGLHAALTYLIQNSTFEDNKNGEDEVFAGSLAYDFTSGLYVAVGYQSRTYQRYLQPIDRNGHTFDVSAAYRLSEVFKLKVGLFDFSDGYDEALSHDFNGYNATLEWLPSSSLRFHLEYLHRNFEYRDDFSSISIGFRYDFSIDSMF
jgi:hypothetical protein